MYLQYLVVFTQVAAGWCHEWVQTHLLFQHPILKHPLPTFLPQCEAQSFTPIQNNRQNYSSIYFNLYIFGKQITRQNSLQKQESCDTWLEMSHRFLCPKNQISGCCLGWISTHPRHQPAATWVNITRYCKLQSNAPDDGRKHHPKHVEPTRNNKLTCTVVSCWLLS